MLRKLLLRYLKPFALLPALVITLAGCGGGGGSGGGGAIASPETPTTPPTAEASCGVESQKAFVQQAVDTWYLWYDEVAQADPAAFEDPQAFLSALTAPLAIDGRDPGFSYLTTREEDERQLSTGAFVGFGFRFEVDATERFWFADVYEDSPAGDAELTRGTQVLAIDVGRGFETIGDLIGRGATTDEIFGANALGVERGFRVRQGETIREVALVKRELVTPPFVGGATLLEREGLSPVGYLNMRAFLSSASAPLVAAFETFGSAGVTDYVIDLRYNGGGLLSVTDEFLDLFGGLIANGQDSFRISHNDKQTSENVSATFGPLPASVEPLRIAFITTEGTASASEMLINSMAPHVELVLVGEDTLGKAVGQYALDQVGCDTRMRLVSFEILNGEGQGGYYTGLLDSGRFTLCRAADDITRNFGDPEEASLSAALDWLNSGTCATTTASAKGPSIRSLAPPAGSLMALAEPLYGRSPKVQ